MAFQRSKMVEFVPSFILGHDRLASRIICYCGALGYWEYINVPWDFEDDLVCRGVGKLCCGYMVTEVCWQRELED